MKKNASTTKKTKQANTKPKSTNIKTAIAELRRAHFVIALLAMIFTFMIIISTIQPIEFDTLLAAIASALLIIVSGVSLATAISLRK